MITTFGHSTLERVAALKMLDSGGVDVLIDVRSHPTSRFTQWQRQHLARWVPLDTEKQIAYQWWPELGGWDVRHAHDSGLVYAMRDVGVDLMAYSGGAFPKQRIAKTLSADSDPACPMHGYSSRTTPETRPAIPDGATMSQSVRGSASGAESVPSRIVDTCSCADYTRQHPQWTNVGLRDYAWFTSLPEFNTGLDRLIAMFGRDDQPTAALMCAEAVWWRCHRSMIADVLVARGVEVRHLPQWKDHLDCGVYDRIGRYPEAVRACWSGVSPEAARLAGDPK